MGDEDGGMRENMGGEDRDEGGRRGERIWEGIVARGEEEGRSREGREEAILRVEGLVTLEGEYAKGDGRK